MVNYLEQLDSKMRKIIGLISKEADRSNLKAYIVGGIVRDILLKKKVLDLDILVEGNARVFAAYVAKNLKAELTVHPDFGTATVKLKNGQHVDFTSARKEVYVHSGALPQVSVGTLIEDLFRRDFTINAMAISINKNSFGKLIDEFNGQADLRKRLVRVLHLKSFEDDPTRILRAIRFEQRLGFKIEKETLKLLISAVNKDLLKQISTKRYLNEINKCLIERNVTQLLKRLNNFGCLSLLTNKSVVKWSRIFTLEKKLKRGVIYNKQEQAIFFLMAILQSNLSEINRVLDRFPFNFQEKNSILQLSKVEAIMNNLSKEKLSRSQVFLELREILDLVLKYILLISNKSIIIKRVCEFIQDKDLKLKISGNDLKVFGILPGKEMGKVLHQLLLERIDQKIFTRKAQLARAKTLASLSI